MAKLIITGKKFLFALLLLALPGINSWGQDYAAILQHLPENAPLADVSQTMRNFFRNNPQAAGRKQWERWKWYAERHLDNDGRVGNITRYNMEALQQMNINTSRFNANTRSEGTELLNGSWSPLGPFSIAAPAQNYLGRINCIAFHPTDVNTIFAGAPGGGLWKTTNGGTNWVPLTDGLPSSGISGIAIQPNNANIIYVLTGDGNGGTNWGYYVKETGCGVYKSTDGGLTWQTTGLNWQQSEVKYGFKLIMHPSNFNILLAATSDGIYHKRRYRLGAGNRRPVSGYRI
jgi:hypothetical protein